MKIAFRNLPFDEAQCDALNAMAAAAGWETLWCPTDAPVPAQVADCAAMMGYFPPQVFRGVAGLKWLQTPSAGVDAYCGDVFPSEDVVLTNCSGAFGDSIAEHMLTGLMMLMRNMPAYLRQQRAHVWKTAGASRFIQGSRITVVGMGDIGVKFARRAKALGARVRGVRRSSAPLPEGFDEAYTSERIGEAVRDADAVVMCLPGTKHTREMVSAEVIAQMKPDAIVINCGRGSTLDEGALIRALREGRLGGAVLDVFAEEPLPADSPLWEMENVILTPHVSGKNDDSLNRDFIFEICRDNLARYLEGRPLTHVVDRSRGY